jgi:hypothetical protein
MTKTTDPKLKVGTKEKGTFGNFIVLDENGIEYGPSAATRKEAEELLKDWKAYYSSPCSIASS